MMIQLTDKVYAVEVPDKIDNPKFYRVNNETIMFKWDDVEHPLNPHDLVRVDKFYGDLKDYKWPRFLFTTKTATEEQAREVVAWIEIAGKIGYYDYMHPEPYRYLENWEESLGSLLRSKGVDENKNYALIEK